MTDYNFEGNAVEVKRALSLGSALVKNGVTITAGNVVVQDGSNRTVDQGGADSTRVLGVARETRTGASTERRPVTYVEIGLVRCIADGAITVGRLVKSGAAGKVKVLNVGGGDTFNEAIGKYVAKGDGTVADAADGDIVQIQLDVSMNGSVT